MQLKGEIAALAAAIMLGGCGAGLVGGGAPATFDLQAPSVEKVRSASAVQLTINPPVAVKTIDTDEILVKSTNGRIAYFPGVAWGDRLPRLFQARLVEAFANSGGFRAILTNQDRVSGDLSLAIEIRNFEIEPLEGGNEAVVDVYVKLIDEKNNAVLTTKRFHTSVPTANDDVNSGIHALNDAFQQVVVAIVSWVSRRSS